MHLMMHVPNSLVTPAGAASAAAAAAANEYAVAINNIDVASEYIVKLRQELEGHAERLFTSASEQDRLRRWATSLSAPCHLYL
jgi:homoserine kinase